MSNSPTMLTLTGLATAPGLAGGPVFVYRGGGEIAVPATVVEAGREGEEFARFRRAVDETKAEIERTVRELEAQSGVAHARVFEGHLMLADDVVLVAEVERLIRERHLNAEAAVRRTAERFRSQFAKMTDPYLRERVRDLDDVERRILAALSGVRDDPAVGLAVPSIVVAEDLTPSETVRLPRELVLGFATDGGSTTSHVALLARALGIPAVTGLGDVARRAATGATALLDGTRGTVILNPTPEARRVFFQTLEQLSRTQAEAAPDVPAGALKDGGEVRLCANLQPGVPLEAARTAGARGIGLYRTEYLWLGRDAEPTEEEQFAAYREAAEFAATLGPGASVTIRALDIGGDKLVRGVSKPEANPFLGNRSIRYLLTHPDVFRAQLRAILRASAFGPVRLMYPMVSCVEELKGAAEALARAKAELDAEGVACDGELKVGAMIEVPSAALNAAALARHVDFFSIGTNDLVQYALAADRGNESVAHLHQPLNPAVLKLVRLTVDAAKARGIPVGVCGESASDPVTGVLWAAMGADELSISPPLVPRMARLLAGLTRRELDEYAARAEAFDGGTPAAEIRAVCRDWLRGTVG